MMNERERLIELLNKSCEAGGLLMNDARTTADYLLENGVVVLPCKVHDTIYIADENSNEFDGIDECRVERVEWNGVFWAIFHDRDNYGYSQGYIGKTVFFTREEAERALKGGKVNE